MSDDENDDKLTAGENKINICQINEMITCKVMISFFNPTDATRVAGSPRIGVGPGFDSQGSVNFFSKYCFPNLH